MLPQIKNGDYVLLFTWLKFMPWPRTQVIFDHPDYGALLKSVTDVDLQKRTFSAKGGNLLSIKAGDLKHMPFSQLKGTVVWQIKRQSSR